MREHDRKLKQHSNCQQPVLEARLEKLHENETVKAIFSVYKKMKDIIILKISQPTFKC